MTEPVPSADFPHLSLGVSLAAPDNCDSSTPGLLPVYAVRDKEVWKSVEEELKGSELSGKERTNSKRFLSCQDFTV